MIKIEELHDFRPLVFKAFERGEILKLNDIFPYGCPKEIEHWYGHVVDQKFLWDGIDDDVQEMNFHGDNTAEITHGKGREIRSWELKEDDLELSFQMLCFKWGIHWNYKRPFASFGMEQGGRRVRVTLLHPCLSPLKRWKVFVRYLRPSVPTFFEKVPGAIWIEEKKNILIAGPTKSGKTTFLKQLIHQVREEEHVVIIEDTHELFVDRKKTTYLLTQDSVDGEFQHHQLKEFCAYCLRISPDRIILGEMRGREVEAFMLLMNSGHQGMMSTIHANSAVDALHRAAMLLCLFQKGNAISYDQALKLVSKNIDLVVYMEGLKIKETIRVIGCDKGQIFFELSCPSA